MSRSKTQPSGSLDDIVDARELEPRRVRAALRLNKWGGRLAATMGALLPACIMLVYSYYRSLRGEAPPSVASPVGVILTMAYFAVLQYMIFVVGGSVMKTRYETNRQLEDLRREMLKRMPLPADPGEPAAKKQPRAERPATGRRRQRSLAKRMSGPRKTSGDALDSAVIDLRGVRAQCQKIVPWFSSPAKAQTYRVLNIGPGGLALRCSNGLKQGDRLHIRLIAPGCEPLDLRAQVRWHGDDGEHDPGAVGLEFMPFNDQHDGNPKEAQGLIDQFRELADMVEAAV